MMVYAIPPSQLAQVYLKGARSHFTASPRPQSHSDSFTLRFGKDDEKAEPQPEDKAAKTDSKPPTTTTPPITLDSLRAQTTVIHANGR